MLKNLFKKCQCAVANEKWGIQKNYLKNGDYLVTGCNWPAFG